MTRPHATRDRILDSLESLLLEMSPTQVTLEAVADRADVSKGGLLYHFPSKAELLVGLVRRLGDRSDRRMADAVDGGTPVARYYLSHPDDTADREDLALFRSTVAALRTADRSDAATHSAVVEVMRSWDDALRGEFDDPVTAEIVRLVGDGIYFAALLGLPRPDPDLYAQVVERLLAGTRDTAPSHSDDDENGPEGSRGAGSR